MNGLLFLIPAALLLGAVGLVAFVWSLSSNQYDDLDGEAERILHDEDLTPRSIADRERVAAASD